MAFGTYDMQSTGFKDRVVAFLPVRSNWLLVAAFRQFRQVGIQAAAEHDIRTATCHVCGDRDRARSTGILHDQSFPFVLLCVQHFMFDLLGREEIR